MKFIVGVYTTSPCLYEWDEKLATEYINGIKELSMVRGLEHPFWGKLHKFDDNWFLKNIKRSWDFVFTCIPGTMIEMSKNPHFGLASDKESGRKAALRFIEKARKAVENINGYLKRSAVIAVQLHSAPNRSIENVHSSKESFSRSLKEIVAWNWHNARLVVEHCDAMTEDHQPEKGFLSIDDEIASVSELNQSYNNNNPIGIVINWGRSVLEERNVFAPIKHVQKAREAGLLCGLMFSGCSNQNTEWGVWKDTHMPPPKELNNKYFAEKSLMNAICIKNTLLESKFDKLDYIGIKIMDLQKGTNMQRRIGLNADTLLILDQIINKLSVKNKENIIKD